MGLGDYALYKRTFYLLTYLLFISDALSEMYRPLDLSAASNKAVEQGTMMPGFMSAGKTTVYTRSDTSDDESDSVDDDNEDDDFIDTDDVIMIINSHSNNTRIIFMVLSSCLKHCKSSPGSCDECSTVPGGRQSLVQANWLEPKPACTLQVKLHSP